MRRSPAGFEELVLARGFGDDGCERFEQSGIAVSSLPEERTSLGPRQIERLVENAIGLWPLTQIAHARSPGPSSRRSQALALNHSRCAVLIETPSAAAVSSSVSPAKYRHSTTRASRAFAAGKFFEGKIDVEHQSGVAITRLVLGLQRDHRLAPATFDARSPPGVVHHNLTHCHRRDREEMAAIAPRRSCTVDQPQVCLVDERRRVERLSGLTPPQLPAGEAAQIVVNERNEAIESVVVARAVGDEKLGHVRHCFTRGADASGERVADRGRPTGARSPRAARRGEADLPRRSRRS